MLKKRSYFINGLNYIFKHIKWFGAFFSLALIGVGYVVVRMKNVELDYDYNTVIGQYHEVGLKNKELKARKAKHLSVKNLRKFAEKFELKEPNQKQVIVIP
jgi:hypothetical protein